MLYFLQLLSGFIFQRLFDLFWFLFFCNYLHLFSIVVKNILLEFSSSESNPKIIGRDNNSMEIFDSKKTVVEARDNDIHLNFWKIAQFNLIQIICIKGRILIIKVKVFFSLFFRIVLQYSRT